MVLIIKDKGFSMKRLFLSICLLLVSSESMYAVQERTFLADIETGYHDAVKDGTKALIQTSIVCAGIYVAIVANRTLNDYDIAIPLISPLLNHYFPARNRIEKERASESQQFDHIKDLTSFAFTAETAMRNAYEKDGADSETYKTYVHVHRMAIDKLQRKFPKDSSHEATNGNPLIIQQGKAAA
jgi:hypothetical protein